MADMGSALRGEYMSAGSEWTAGGMTDEGSARSWECMNTGSACADCLREAWQTRGVHCADSA